MADFSRPAAVRPMSANGTPLAAKQPSLSASRAAAREMTPSSTLLQDRLREKKARTLQVERARSHRPARHDTLFSRDDGFADNRVTMSSPVQAAQDMDEPANRRRSDVGAKKNSRSVGVREVNDIIDGLHKANFDLKLELYHRRARMTDLEQQIELYKQLEDDNVELQEVNESLLAELEKRERAIEEAVAIICDLEEKLEHYEACNTRPSTAQPETDTSTLKGSDNTPHTSPGDKERPKTPQEKLTVSITSSPRKSPRKAGDLSTPKRSKTPGMPRRTPSFLTSEASSNAGALRSLYLAGENDSKIGNSLLGLARFNSTASRDQPAAVAAAEDGLDSPRLSVLSESSFVSVYGNTKNLNFELPGPVIPIQTKTQPVAEDSKQARAARVDRWIDHSSPSKPPKTAITTVGTPTFGPKKSPTKNKSPERHSPRQEIATYRVRARKDGKVDGDGKLMSHHSFGSALLPPTPDTMSVGEAENLRKVPSLVADKSLLDAAPSQEQRSSGHVSSSRPFSAGAPNTRKRDQQDWQDLDGNDLASSDGDLESVKGEFGDHDEFALDLTQLSVLSTLSPTSAKAFHSQAPGVARLGTYQGNILFTGEGLGLSPVKLSENCAHGYHIAPQPGHRSSSLQRTEAKNRLRESAPRFHADQADDTTPTLQQHHRRRERKLETHNMEPEPESEPKEAETATNTPANESRFPLSMRFRTPKSAGSSNKRNSLTSRLFSRSHTADNTPASQAPEPPQHQHELDEAAPAPIIRPVRPVHLSDRPPVPRHRGSTGSLDATPRSFRNQPSPYDDLDFDIPFHPRGDSSTRNKRHSAALEQFTTSHTSLSATDLSKLENQRYKPGRTTSDFVSPTAGRHRRRDSFFRSQNSQGSEKLADQETLPVDIPAGPGSGRKWLPGSLGRSTSIKSPSEPSTRSSRHGFMGRIRGSGKEKDKPVA